MCWRRRTQCCCLRRRVATRARGRAAFLRRAGDAAFVRATRRDHPFRWPDGFRPGMSQSGHADAGGGHAERRVSRSCERLGRDPRFSGATAQLRPGAEVALDRHFERAATLGARDRAYLAPTPPPGDRQPHRTTVAAACRPRRSPGAVGRRGTGGDHDDSEESPEAEPGGGSPARDRQPHRTTVAADFPARSSHPVPSSPPGLPDRRAAGNHMPATLACPELVSVTVYR
jgi:hypothetical protein